MSTDTQVFYGSSL